MALSPLPSFIGPTYVSQSPNADCEDCINFYCEAIQSGAGKNALALYPTPGQSDVLTLPTYPIRAEFAMDGRAWAVGGAVIYEVFYNATTGIWSAIARGTMAVDANPATICSNGDIGRQLLISSGKKAYTVDLDSNAFAHVLDGVTVVAFMDGYFLALDVPTSTLKLSDFADGSTWDPTQVAQRNLAADRWVGMIVPHPGEVLLMGSESSEWWTDTGAFPFPLAPQPGASMRYGTASGFSLANVGNAVMFLSKNSNGHAEVMKTQGYGAIPVSTFAVNFALQGYATVSDANVLAYQDQGHAFYALTFPTANATWVYDDTMSLWHKRGFWNTMRGDYDAYRPQYHMFAFDKHIVGDRVTGVLSECSIAFTTDAEGANIRRLRIAPHVNNNHQWLYEALFQLDLEVGLGTTPPDQGADPTVMLSMSRDGGKTYGTERWVNAGEQGAYRAQAQWRMNGRYKDGVRKLVMTDPIPWRLINAYADISAGT